MKSAQRRTLEYSIGFALSERYTLIELHGTAPRSREEGLFGSLFDEFLGLAAGDLDDHPVVPGGKIVGVGCR